MRSTSWLDTISESVLEEPGREFSIDEVASQTELFAHRAALFYTPTRSIPKEHIGEGELRMSLPIVTPDYTEYSEGVRVKSARFWVDLIQRQTHKIRWVPLEKTKITIVRHDYYSIRPDHFSPGIKSLVDSFKY